MGASDCLVCFSPSRGLDIEALSYVQYLQKGQTQKVCQELIDNTDANHKTQLSNLIRWFRGCVTVIERGFPRLLIFTILQQSRFYLRPLRHISHTRPLIYTCTQGGCSPRRSWAPRLSRGRGRRGRRGGHAGLLAGQHTPSSGRFRTQGSARWGDRGSSKYVYIRWGARDK